MASWHTYVPPSHCGPNLETCALLLEEPVFSQIKPSTSRSWSITLSVVLIAAFLPHTTPDATTEHSFRRPIRSFVRVATYDVPGQVAEIVASTPDGKTLIYTDSASEEIGFVSITNPKHPTSSGSLKMPGEPTSVAVTPDGTWALVAVHKSKHDVLVVVDLAPPTIHTTIALGGQPDSVAISTDGQYAAIAIENERDEDVNEGAMPQPPTGS